MFVLDDLYASDEVLDYLEESKEPVFDNAAARRYAQSRSLNISDTSDAAAPGRICATSEVHLDDIKRFADEDTVRGIELFKDKAACRRALAPLFPDFVFEEYSAEDLQALDPDSIRYPVVVKPSTGFFSLGIYSLFDADAWRQAMAEIAEGSSEWNDSYDETVVDSAKFLVESYVEGDEYAIDAYFDGAGRVVVLNILKHDFAGDTDVSDRLYYTSCGIISEMKQVFEEFLEAANTVFNLRDFPFHAEVRVDAQGRVVPIEFNPLRFAGLCTTDISYFAYGFKTYACFFEDSRPDWEAILEEKDGLACAMILLTKMGFDAKPGYAFDYPALAARFRKVLALRQTDFAKLGTFGMLFTETRAEDWDGEIVPMLTSSLDEFLA